MRKCSAQQTDQLGERHGRSLSWRRRHRRKRACSDGARYRLYVKRCTGKGGRRGGASHSRRRGRVPAARSRGGGAN